MAVVSAEFQNLIEEILIEWNSGDTARWRATFAPEAVGFLVSGLEYPIEADQDSHEFFATLSQRYELIGCKPAATQLGEAARCEIELPNQFNERLGLGLGPVVGNRYLQIVDGLIVRYGGHNVALFGPISAAWRDFALWVSERNADDGLAMGSFPGNRAAAEVALPYLDEYFQE